MHPKIHILLGLFFVFALYLFFPKINLIGLGIIFISSVLIDGDHYVYYFLKEKKLGLIKCYKWYKEGVTKTCSLPLEKRKKIYTGFYFFHGVEWLIILSLYGFFLYPILLFVFLGFSFHLFLDIISEIKVKRTIHKISLIYNYNQWKKLKN